jgi:hypothetical protein
MGVCTAEEGEEGKCRSDESVEDIELDVLEIKIRISKGNEHKSNWRTRAEKICECERERQRERERERRNTRRTRECLVEICKSDE